MNDETVKKHKHIWEPVARHDGIEYRCRVKLSVWGHGKWCGAVLTPHEVASRLNLYEEMREDNDEEDR